MTTPPPPSGQPIRTPAAGGRAGAASGAGPERVPRELRPIPDRPPVGLTTDGAEDPDTRSPPIVPLRPPGGAPAVPVSPIAGAGSGASGAGGGPCRTPDSESSRASSSTSRTRGGRLKEPAEEADGGTGS
jgi:hypothetical protein